MLLILAPLLGEIVSGHQPPAELCNPLSVVLLMLPYGLGALVCRELVRRWKKGWLSLILLGIAYAFYEEAIVVRSFFNPDWLELNVLKPYSFLGVNWTYAAMLVHFHVLVSIAAGILLTEMLYPDRREEPWLGDKGLIACLAGLALWVPAGILFSAYLPPLPGYLLSWLAIGGLILAARFAPANAPAPVKKNPPHPLLFLLLGFFNMTLFFIVTYVLPELLAPPAGLSDAGVQGFYGIALFLSLLGLAMLDALTLWVLLRWSGNGGAWEDRHRLGWVAGGLGFFLLFNVTSDLEAFAGRSCVSATAVFGLILLGALVNRRGKPAAGES
jgi:hypothetical protein